MHKAPIKSVRNFFRQKKGNKTIDDNAIRDIRNLINQEKEDYYEAKIILNIKAMEIKIKQYQ